MRILSSVNLKTAAIKKVVCLCVCISEFILKKLCNLINKFICCNLLMKIFLNIIPNAIQTTLHFRQKLFNNYGNPVV